MGEFVEMSKEAKFRYGIITLVFIIVLLIGAGVYFLAIPLRDSRNDVEFLRMRLAEATEKPQLMYIHDTVPVYQTKVVEVDRTDYKKQLADRELIKDLKLKVAQVESENRMLIASRDTVFLTEKGDSVYTYTDKWAHFSYDVRKNELEYAIRDSITTIVSREYRHKILWGLIKWGTKGYNVHNISHNPHSSVEYNKYIMVK